MTQLFQLLRYLTVAAGVFTASAVSGAESVTQPFVIAPDCTQEQVASLSAVAGIRATPIACYAFEKWSFKGAGVAYELQPGTTVSPDDFRALQRTAFRDQSARLRTQRDLREAMPDQPPAHSTIPMSLLVNVRTPLGVFVDTSDYTGFADLVPVSRGTSAALPAATYPLIQLEVLVLRGSKLFRLVLLSQITGTTTVAEGYRIAEGWALSLLGRARSAGQQ